MANLNFNKVILGGRLTADSELKQTPQGVSVTSFAIAINRKSNKDVTDFINCVAWRSTAEFISKYFHKGSSIVLDGEIQVRTWKDQQGKNRYATEVIVSDAYFVDSKGETEVPQQAFKTPNEPCFEEIDNTDDDLPF